MKKVYIILVYFLSIRLFSFSYIDGLIYDIIDIILLVTFIIILFLNKNVIKYRGRFYTTINWLILLTVLSSIPAYFFHDQSLYYSLLASRFVFFWFWYYVLNILKPEPKFITNILLVIGITWAIINIAQQFSFPVILFQNKAEIEIDNVIKNARGGIFRLYDFMDMRFAMFAILIYWFRIIDKQQLLKNLLIFLIILTGLFFTGSRQVIFSLLVILFLSFFNFRRFFNTNFGSVIFVLLLLFPIILYFFGNYISELIYITELQNIASLEYIRWLAAEFFLLHYWPNEFSFVALLFGNGWEHFYSQYGYEIHQLKQSFGLYRSDIGLLGAINKFGIVYFIAVLYLLIKWFKIEISNNSPIILFFIIFLFLTSWTGKNYFEYQPTIILISSLLYLTDLNYKNQLYA